MTTPVDHARLLRRGLRLEYATLAWNVFAAVIVLWSAWRARSIGLAGFGLDSVIEIFASVVVVWQLKGGGHDREVLAMHLIGAAFFMVAAYIIGQLIFTVTSGVRPAPSILGLASLFATISAMLLLAWGKHLTGRQLGNPVLMVEARVTLIDAALAFAVFIGVGLNTLFGWWWADPLSGLVVLYYAVKEGRTAWRHSAPSIA
jgi:divalent metal cation (Fe/Co/Zn/Cd) transporter